MCLPSQSLRVYLPFQREASAKENLLTKHKTTKHELTEVQKDIANVEAVQNDLETSIETGLGLINHKNKKVSEVKVLVKEKENLQKKLKNLEKLCAVQKAMAGTSLDVENMLKQKQPPDTLAAMAVSLKK